MAATQGKGTGGLPNKGGTRAMRATKGKTTGTKGTATQKAVRAKKVSTATLNHPHKLVPKGNKSTSPFNANKRGKSSGY